MNAKDLNGIEVFLAVVQAKSFSGAARDLSLSQPGVGRAIARLEERLGLRLFERTTRRVSLTEQGRQLYQRIHPLLEAVEDALTQVGEQQGMVRGRLRVGVDTVFLHLISAPALKRFLYRHPELRLDLVSRDHLGDLRQDLIDLDLRFGEIRAGSYIVRKLGATRVLTVAAPSYLEQAGTPQLPTDLVSCDHVLIDFRNPQTFRPFPWVFRRGQDEVTVPTSGRLILNDVATMHRLCLAGFGIAQVLEVAARKHLASGRLVPLFPEWQDEGFPLHAVFPSREHLPRRTRAFLGFVRRHLAALG